ncbi:hypothetical protein FRB91_003193 [Serendipita sp. 411]|nr:hypothetical protein FRB91_003193 [Serendipita sp. 411]
MATSTLTVSTSFPEGHGDFKLISSDGVTFHFPRYLLCLMSPSFEGMFDVIGNDAQPQELNMVENSTTVDQFLRFLDPRMKVLPLNFETVAPLLETARKYEVPKILEWWEEQVVVKVDGIAPDKTSLRKPMACLALASRFDLPNTARLAFRDLVKAPSKDLITDIRFESQLFCRLIQLREERVAWFINKITTYHNAVSTDCRSCYVSHEQLSRALRTIVTDIGKEPSWATLNRHMAAWKACPVNHFYASQTVFNSWQKEILELESSLPTL